MPEQTKTCLETSQDHALLTAAVREAGVIARQYFQTDFTHWDKKKGDPVTEADLAIDSMLRRELTTARPDYGWLSEETEDDATRLERQKVWIVDPIDGTRAFIKGIPHFTISAALVVNGHSVSAVVYNPITDHLYEAQKGHGARLNGQVIHVSTRQTLENCRMLGDAKMFTSTKWDRNWPAMKIETRNSIALRLGLVASGVWDACLTLARKSDWDIAAGDLIIKEAGGQVSNHKGEAFVYNRPHPVHAAVISAGKPLHRELIERVAHIDLPPLNTTAGSA